MITVIYGPARGGKTSFILNEIKHNGEAGRKSILIVPEQYSHDAERHLCISCGNQSSMYAEVLSFSRLCSRVIGAETSLGYPLNAGGRLLLMVRALNLVLPEMRTFRNIRRKADFAAELIHVYDEMRSAGVLAEQLAEASEKTHGMTADKLHDISLIFAAYDGHMPEKMYDPNDALDILAKRIKENDIGKEEKIYIDGFSEFTMQQKTVVREFIKKSNDVVITLTCDSMEDNIAAFQNTLETAEYIIRTAKEERKAVDIINVDETIGKQEETLTFFGKNLFSYGSVQYQGECENIELYRADTQIQECEIAASRIIELVRDKKYRWKDFAIAVRDWEEWQITAKNIFVDYEIPLQMAEKSDILEKPIMAAVFSAIDIILGDWEYKSVFKYLKTGMTGLKAEDIYLLENYVITWNIRGSGMWRREEDWAYNPDGYVKEISDAQKDMLVRINGIRKKVAQELSAFEDNMRKSHTGKEKAKALYEFLEAANMPEILEEKAGRFRAVGNTQLCDEYLQIWDILVSGLEQYADIIAEEETTNEEFAELLRLVMSQYEVGTIPVSLDRVSIGDIARMKRRDIKCLILMGMTEDAVPRLSDISHILSDEEREELEAIGISFGNGVDSRISREMNIIYTSVTLPSDRLIMSWSSTSGRGKASFVVNSAEKMFGIETKRCGEEIKINASLPCFEYAVGNFEDSVVKRAAVQYFALSDIWKTRFEKAENAARIPRGRLSREAAGKLYSKKINLTASRVDKYYSCRFSYFMQYGLRVRKRKTAGFDAPEAGTFMHYLLENVAGEAEKLGGFGKIEQNTCRRLTRKYAEEYVKTVLNGFKDKSSRFKYLFNRLASDAETVVLDMAEELARSDFKPIGFELSFAPEGDLPPAKVTDGDTEVNVMGIVDRADGWLHDDKLYLRVIDYKTGKKAFNLSDIWYGLGMQMLIYLFVLQKSGDKHYGKQIIPAGVMYAPARDIIMQMPRSASDEDIEKERSKRLGRKGLLLKDPEVIESMEHGKNPKYLPVKFKKDGTISSEYIAGLEQLGKLSRHIDSMLLKMGKELRDGAIDADPYYREPQDNACYWCDFFEACHFNDTGGDDKIRYLRKLKTPEAWDKITGEEK